MKRLSETMSRIYKEMVEAAQSDMEEYTQENLEKMMYSMLSSANFGDMSSMFGDTSGFAGAFKGFGQTSTVSDPYRILGLDRDCTDDELKHRYREIMFIIHPDRTAGKTTRIAEMVNIAYDQIWRERR